jgi:transglutaminase-like putative cysteine protease
MTWWKLGASAPGPHAVQASGPYGFVAAGAALSVGTATVAGAAHFDLPLLPAFLAGAVVGLLAILALPSVPTRLATPLALASGGFVLTRYARAGAVPPAAVVGWGVATLATLIALEHAESSSRTSLHGEARRSRSLLGSGVAGMFAVTALALVLWPVLAAANSDSRRGEAPDPFADTSDANLLDSDTLSTRTRPHLGDEIVMRVTADRPSFWRGATFDVWDGSTWTRSDTGPPAVLARRGTADGPTIVPAGDGARIGASRVNTQTFEIVAPYATVAFAAPEAVEIDTDHVLSARADGTVLAAFDPLGSGARYTVRSEEPLATAASLSAAVGETPAGLAAQYAQPAPTTDRVRALARDITATSTTTYDKVLAIEAWLGANVEYSLTAPLPPASADDTVDWFVFDGRAGWCEQIASTTVVMLRELGIPARLVTGFVPGDHDPLTGRYTVRAKHAHAWAEVWFPGVGWQGFDPTASVPLSGESAAPTSMFTWIQQHTLGFCAFVVGGLLLGWGARILLRRLTARRDRVAPSWAAVALADLEHLGERVARPRAIAETPRRYARELAAELHEPDLVAVGAVIDAAGFGDVPVPDASRDDAQATLTRLLG